MTRLTDALASALTGMLVGVLLVAVAIPSRPFVKPHDVAEAVPAVVVAPVVAAAAPAGTVSGTASFVGPRFGPRYLALPEGRGVRVEICSPAGRCVTRVSTDAGPDRAMQRAGRVADVSFEDFAYLCGCDPWVVGLMPVTVTRGAALPPPPDTATDAEPDFRGPAALLFLFWLLWFTTRQGDR